MRESAAPLNRNTTGSFTRDEEADDMNGHRLAAGTRPAQSGRRRPAGSAWPPPPNESFCSMTRCDNTDQVRPTS